MPNFEKFNPGGDEVYYIIADRNGRVFDSTKDYSSAWKLAKSVDGWLGETTWGKPVDFKELAGEKVGAEIEHFLDNPGSGVRRGRPDRKVSSATDSAPSASELAAVDASAVRDDDIDNNE